MRTCVAQALRRGASHGLPGPYSVRASSREPPARLAPLSPLCARQGSLLPRVFAFGLLLAAVAAAQESSYTALKEVLISRYQLDLKYITDILYENDVITVYLVQNSQKIQNDVDIDDVAYCFEKEVKDESLFQSKRMGLKVNGELLDLDPV
ncbi:hypothetical protein J1605_016061 [Eschrichtius robustus]|uniref:EPCAM/Trop-2 C-terminal domain-containing protein n=1 Tax=Eschrichtius robustus TaxID=9764 RepID=A0AB34GC10_ESCRO|nr:hypothetical protein J1605_016061 [Eschrichtius robustus]